MQNANDPAIESMVYESQLLTHLFVVPTLVNPGSWSLHDFGAAVVVVVVVVAVVVVGSSHLIKQVVVHFLISFPLSSYSTLPAAD